MGKYDIYPQVRDNFKIDSLTNRPQNIGKITQKEAKELNGELFTFKYGSCEDGFAVKIYLVLNNEKRVIDCKMEVFGESELLAVASIAGLICKNKTPDEILNLKDKGLEYFLRENPNTPALPKRERFLTNKVIYALYLAAKELKGETIKDDEVVDSFSGATKRFIKDTIKRLDLNNLYDVVDYTAAGAYDKSCLYPGAGDKISNYYLTDILQESLKEKENESKNIDLNGKDFKDMNLEEKRAAIEAIIDQNIRHMLIMDGGDMEILDIKENGENTDIYIRYLGACSGCASSSTGTLFAIEGILKQKLDPNIRVIPL